MKLDLPLLGGYVAILAIIYLGLTLSHGTPAEIWSGEGIILAFGGALAGTMAMLSTTEIKEAWASLKVAFTQRTWDYQKLIDDFGRYADISRRDGILALERVAASADDAFLKRLLQMAVDGVSPDTMEDQMAVELSTLEERHSRGRNVYDTLATFSPAMGMVGTIMGLVLVLKNLSDPSSLGPKMAMALLSTFYGVFACYAVFTPIAKKLERKHKHEMLYKQMIVKGLVWIQSGDSARVITGKLRSFLRESKRA